MPEKPGRLIGRRIAKIRWMTSSELAKEGWPARDKVVVLELDDGTIIMPSSDYEGNSSGALFGRDSNGQFYVTVGK